MTPVTPGAPQARCVRRRERRRFEQLREAGLFSRNVRVLPVVFLFNSSSMGDEFGRVMKPAFPMRVDFNEAAEHNA